MRKAFTWLGEFSPKNMALDKSARLKAVSGLAVAAALAGGAGAALFSAQRDVLPYLGAAFGSFALFAALSSRRAPARAASARDLPNDIGASPPDGADFDARLGGLLRETRRLETRAAVLLIELDRLADGAETHGAPTNDRLVETAAHRLQRIVRAGDHIGRVGGERFGVIMPNAPAPQGMIELSNRIAAALNTPYVFSGSQVIVRANVGVAVIDRTSAEPSRILRHAEAALQRARAEGGAKACVYDPEMDAKRRDQEQFQMELREAIGADGLMLAYQPIVRSSDEVMIGVEALCRWRHRTRGDIPPAAFIAAAEACGLIVPLGEWVLRSACREARKWPGMLIAVNVSSHQFQQPDFVGVVQKALAETGLEPTRLEIELTESLLIDDIDDARAKMTALKRMGVRLALDDFGTGYSSLNYLLSLPFDKLKIDRSFILKIDGGAYGAAIVHSIVSLGRGLGMQVTGEGVETAEQQQFLRIAGVHSLQGYRFGRPAEPAIITARLAAQTFSEPQQELAAAAG